nr:protein FAR1-RELATED SEQUENCE 5-like [Aegilops tauschii subsp. strangulata]
MEVTEVEGKKNVQDTASADDKRDMFMQIIQITFTSHEAAYDFYNSYARDNGFSIRKNRVRYSKTESRHMRYRRFVCSRQGKRDSRLLTEEGHSRRLRPETRCHCEAHLTVKLDQKRGVWYVDSFEDKHIHILAGPDEVPFLWSHRKIKEYQKHEIMSMGAAGIRIHDMMDCFISKHVWYGGVGFTRREIYNLCAREKRKLLSKGDAATVIGIMVSRKQRDPSFFFEYKLDKEGHMNRMFWCDSQSRHDYEDFGDVLVFDSTYKMNRYGMPFIPFVGLNNHRKTTVFACAIVSDETEETYVWLLETFLRSMCQKMPMSVITDADAAMIKAIRQVFRDVWHRICTWHIEKNMKIHLSHKSLKEFRTLLYYSTSTATFEERWHAFSKRWQSEKTVTWLRRMYKKRRLWAAAYLTEGFWLGMKSNQRSESLNSCLHLHLDGEMTLVDMILHYENAVVRIRENEARDDCTASQSLPVPVTSSRELEIAASHVFTPANFYMLQADLRKIGGMEIVEIKLGDGSQQYIVAWKNNRKSLFGWNDGEGNILEVHDPIKVSTKGATKEEVKCNYVEWVDPEWSVATKFCLRELWSMYDEKLRQNIKNAEEKCMLIGEKRRTEEELRFFKMDFAKLVADKEDALTQLGNATLSLSNLKEELEKNKMADHGCANLHQVLRVKAEKDRDRVVLERDQVMRERDQLKQEKKKLEYIIAEIFSNRNMGTLRRSRS